MSGFIPNPYVDHREAWRKAYLSLYGPMDVDDELKTAVQEHERKLEAAAQEYLHKELEINEARVRKARRAMGAIISSSSKIDRGIHGGAITSTGGGRTIAESMLKQSEPIRAETDKNAESDPVPFLFSENGKYMPSARFNETRNSILQKLFDGELFAYLDGSKIVKLESGGFWFAPGAETLLRDGGNQLHHPKGMRYDLFFDGNELDRAFPPKLRAKNVLGSRKVGRPRKRADVAARYAKTYPNGCKAAGVTVNAARLEIERLLEMPVGKETFRKARQDSAVDL